jgi:YegS/Rv2252/BmrU family lipid kinase
MARENSRRLVAIVNPAAGHGRAQTRWRRVERLLGQHSVRPEVWHSRHQGHATELTREAIELGFTTILAVGGDGTIHEVVNGFSLNGHLSQSVQLGIVPGGTGMDFVRNIGVGRGIEAAAQRILRGRPRRIDVGLWCNGPERSFVNFAETGIGAAVVAREAQIHRSMPGRASYFFAAMEAVRKQENMVASISVDGIPAYDGPLVSVVVANGRYVGGGMKIAPRARIDDGELDVLVLGDFTRGELLTQIWKIYPGVHLSHSKVAWLRGSRVDVDPLGPTRLDLDGELFGPGPYSFTILPRALAVLT